MRVAPTGTAVTDYQVPLGNRHSLREAGVIGLPSWSEKSTQTETWTKVPRLSATCPRRVVAFDGGKSAAIERVMEFGDDFDGSSPDSAKWDLVGSGAKSVSGGVLAIGGVSGSDNGISSKATFGTGYALRARFKTAHDSLNGCYENCQWKNSGSSVQCSLLASGVSSGPTIYNYDTGLSAAVAVTGSDWTADTYATIEAIRKADRATWKIGAGSYDNTNQYPTAALSVQFITNSNIAGMTVDWVAVRKYTAAEPLAGTAQPTATNRALSRPMSRADLIRACCT